MGTACAQLTAKKVVAVVERDSWRAASSPKGHELGLVFTAQSKTWEETANVSKLDMKVRARGQTRGAQVHVDDEGN